MTKIVSVGTTGSDAVALGKGHLCDLSCHGAACCEVSEVALGLSV